MKIFNLELTQNEVYFIHNIIGNISLHDFKDIIQVYLQPDQDGNTDKISSNLLNLLSEDPGVILDSIYKKTSKYDIRKPIKLVKKYKVLYKDEHNDYKISVYYYISKEQFDSETPYKSFAELINDSMIEVEE